MHANQDQVLASNCLQLLSVLNKLVPLSAQMSEQVPTLIYVCIDDQNNMLNNRINCTHTCAMAMCPVTRA